jgi:hypothetical protein
MMDLIQNRQWVFSKIESPQSNSQDQRIASIQDRDQLFYSPDIYFKWMEKQNRDWA